LAVGFFISTKHVYLDTASVFVKKSPR